MNDTDNDSNNWSFDDEEFLIEEEDDDRPEVARGNPDIQPSSILKDLIEYVDYISGDTDRTLRFANRQLESLDSPSKALELREYYLSKDLKSYTLDTELHRLGYTVVHGSQTLTEAEDIVQFARSDNFDLLWRASNQSLLADVLGALTSESGLIRPQYNATAIASKCHFLLDFNEGFVQCHCQLEISIAFLAGDDRLTKLNLVTIEVEVTFMPLSERPVLTVRALRVVPNRNITRQDLDSAASFLSVEDSSNNVHFVDPSFDRDQYVRSMILKSTSGMTTALKQMDSVVNVKSKFSFLSNLTLPTADLLGKAMQEEELFVNHAANHHPPMTLYPPPPSHSTREESRPAPILGGMMKNFTQMAISAAMPDPEKHHTKTVQLYNTERDDHEPTLYRRAEEEKHVPQFTKHVPIPVPPEKQTIERLDLASEENGWSDDGLDFADDEEEINFIDDAHPANELSGEDNDDSVRRIFTGRDDLSDQKQTGINTREKWLRPYHDDWIRLQTQHYSF